MPHGKDHPGLYQTTFEAIALTFGMSSVCKLAWILSTAFACNICWSGRLQAIQQKDHSWAQASFTQVHLRIRFYLICVGTEICIVTATTKITTRASLSTAGLCHPVTGSWCYLEKPYNVALFPYSTINSCIMPASRNFLLFRKWCWHNCWKPK